VNVVTNIILLYVTNIVNTTDTIPDTVNINNSQNIRKVWNQLFYFWFHFYWSQYWFWFYFSCL